jgi:hypothetical protein
MIETELNDILKDKIKLCLTKLYEKNILTIKPEEAIGFVYENQYVKSKFVLPYCGKIYNNICYGMRKNHGLYTQCPNKKYKNGYCKICFKSSLNSPTEKPVHGDIRDRERLKKENKLIGLMNYGNVIYKLNISRKDVNIELNRLNISIPEEEFEIKKKRRGRPKTVKQTNNVVYDTDEEVEEEKINPMDLMLMEMAVECST